MIEEWDPSDATPRKRKVTCEECSLADVCLSNNMRPVGFKKPDVLFVLDYPSAGEDKAGKAMSSGIEAKFKKILHKLGFDSWKVRYTKAVRCHPGRQNVGVTHIKRCRDTHLVAEIEKCKPKIVVAVGSRALASLTGVTAGIASLSGSFVDSPYHKKVFALMSPAGMVYNREVGKRIGVDLARLKLSLEGKSLAAWKPKLIVCENQADVAHWISKLYPCDTGFDYEVSHRTGRIACVSLAGEDDRGIVIPFPDHPDCPSGLRKYKVKLAKPQKILDYDTIKQSSIRVTGPYLTLFEFLSKSQHLLAHNASYELLISRFYGFRPSFKFDSMLAMYQLDPDAKGRFGLDYATSTYVPEAGAYWTKIPDLSKVDVLDIPGDDLFQYNLMDAVVTRLLLSRLSKALREKFSKVFDWRECHNYFMDYVTPMLARLQYNGWKVNEDTLHRTRRVLEKRIARLHKKLQGLPETKRTLKIVNRERELEGKKPVEEYNTKSPLLSQTFIFRALRNKNNKKLVLPDYRKLRGKTGFTTEHKALEPYLKEHFGTKKNGDVDNAAYMLRHELNQTRHFKSTYSDSVIEEHLKPDGYIHPSYIQHGTATVRLSSRNPNGQNYPERPPALAKLLKEPFVSRFPGGKIVGADLSQIEVRVAAAYGNDKAMIEIFEAGVDPYLGIAYKLFVEYGSVLIGKKAAKRDLDKHGKKSRWRKIAKDTTLAIMFQKEAKTLARNLGMDEDDADDLINEVFFGTFTGIAKYVDRTLRFGRKHGFVTTKSPVFARMVPMINIRERASGNLSRDEAFILEMKQREDERVAVNAPIQGQGSGILPVIWLKHITDEIRRKGYRSVLCGTVHDSGYFDTANKHVAKVMKLITRITRTFTQKDQYLKDWLKVPIECEVKAGNSWGALVDS